MKNKSIFKKILYIFIGIIILVGLAVSINYLVKSNTQKEEEVLTQKPTVEDFEEKAVATGKIEPKEEVEIKPNLSGIIEKIYVKEGDKVSEGQLLATIKIVPNVVQVNSAQQEIANAQLQISNSKANLENQQKQFEMDKQLYNEGVISKQEFIASQQKLSSFQQQLSNSKQQLNTANKSLQIAKTGITPGLENLATTQVRSKVSGTILEIPVKIGSQVIEANSFNSGTTICSIADLNSLIFKGTIDEAQVGRIKEEMPMNIIIGALQDSFSGKVTLIAPKGKDEMGTIKFPIEGILYNPEKQYIRAGFSANAEIILNSEKGALLVDESLIQYDEKDKPFVEVKQPNNQFEKVYVKLGSSNGIKVQVLSGITKDSEIKVWNPTSEEKEELGD